MDLISQLSQLCEQLGVEKSNSRLMAEKLLKRSKQLAQSRSISETEALHYLLRLLKEAREQGDQPDAAL